MNSWYSSVILSSHSGTSFSCLLRIFVWIGSDYLSNISKLFFVWLIVLLLLVVLEVDDDYSKVKVNGIMIIISGVKIINKDIRLNALLKSL